MMLSPSRVISLGLVLFACIVHPTSAVRSSIELPHPSLSLSLFPSPLHFIHPTLTYPKKTARQFVVISWVAVLCGEGSSSCLLSPSLRFSGLTIFYSGGILRAC